MTNLVTNLSPCLVITKFVTEFVTEFVTKFVTKLHWTPICIGARGGFVCQVSGALSDSPSKASHFLQIFHYICGKEWIFSKYLITFVQGVDFLQVFHYICGKEWIFSKYLITFVPGVDFITFVQVVDAPRVVRPWSPQQSTISSGQLVSDHRTSAIRH